MNNGGSPFWIHGSSMSSTIRTRDEVYLPRGTATQYTVTSSSSNPLVFQVGITGRQTTMSRNNPLWRIREKSIKRHLARGESYNSDFLKKLRRQDIGGNFSTVRQKYGESGEGTTRQLSLTTPYIAGITYTYNGPLFARSGLVEPDSSVWPSYSDTDLNFELLSAGATAIARTIPTNPAVGGAQAIGESLEALPRLPGMALLGKAGSMTKKFADEYLNLEFGIKPLLSDVSSTVETIRESNKILEELRRNSGRLIRRSYSFPESREITTLSAEGEVRQPYPAISTQHYVGGQSRGAYTWRRETIKRIWFSGAYTYHLDLGHDLRSRLNRSMQEANRLYGLRLTPELAWELTPWSWAADWFVNAGDVLTNLSAFAHDGLVLAWGYVMCDMRIIDTHTTRANLKVGDRVLTQTFETHVKKRVKATPYGFGLDPDWSDLSPRQLAILSALGLSRGA